MLVWTLERFPLSEKSSILITSSLERTLSAPVFLSIIELRGISHSPEAFERADSKYALFADKRTITLSRGAPFESVTLPYAGFRLLTLEVRGKVDKEKALPSGFAISSLLLTSLKKYSFEGVRFFNIT